jgi:hypothetical protein
MRFKLFIFLTATLVFLFCTDLVNAQMPNYVPIVKQMQSTEFKNSMLHNWNHFYGNSEGDDDDEVIIQKHTFKVIFKDSTSKFFYGMIEPDSTISFLLWEDNSVKEKDSARFKKIYPNQTKSIIRADLDNSVRYEGKAADSCWLFKAISGKINAYSAVPNQETTMDFIIYIQKDNGPLQKMNHRNLWEMIKDNEKALKLFYKDKYQKAMLLYNKN